MILNINKATGKIVDRGQHYDERHFDNIEVSEAEAEKYRPHSDAFIFANGSVVKKDAAGPQVGAVFVLRQGQVGQVAAGRFVILLYGEVLIGKATLRGPGSSVAEQAEIECVSDAAAYVIS
jgi:hypothetical protein